MDKISIVTSVCRNQKLEDLQQFVESLFTKTNAPYELILVDNGTVIDNHEIYSYIQELQHENIKIITFPFNMGLGISSDVGVRATTTKHIFRVDTDIVFKTADWSSKMIDIYNQFENIGSVCPGNTSNAIMNSAGYMEADTIIGCCQYVPKSTIEGISANLLNDKPKLINEINKMLEAGDNKYPLYIKHLAMLKMYFERAEGYWDPNFYYGTDDFDYSLLLKYFGYKLARADNVEVIHKSTSERPELKAIRHTTVGEGFQYFRLKWELILKVLGDNNNIVITKLKSIFGDIK